jgi:protein-S-isoprenylcysteine O-methyltransferase Ste14
MNGATLISLLKSIVQNVVVVAVGFGLALLASNLDSALGIYEFKFLITTVVGYSFLVVGFLLRVWATFYFYQDQMKVISLKPGRALITSGPYAFSRNPLYLGGNFLIFLGASYIIGTPSGLALTLFHLPLVDLFIQREEKQLQEKFRDEWIAYAKRVRRWI